MENKLKVVKDYEIRAIKIKKNNKWISVMAICDKKAIKELNQYGFICKGKYEVLY